jgi:hypothetical protein
MTLIVPGLSFRGLDGPGRLAARPLRWVERVGQIRPWGTFGPVIQLSKRATLVLEAIAMSISVGHARKHGATGEIAERMAETLTSEGHRAETRPVQQADDLGGYQRFGIAQQLTRLDAGRVQQAPR